MYCSMRRPFAHAKPTTTQRQLRVSAVRSAACAIALVCAITTIFAQGTQTLRVVPLVKDDHVLVSFELTGGLTDEVRDAIKSGLKTTFTYTVELRLDVPAWVDRTIGLMQDAGFGDLDVASQAFGGVLHHALLGKKSGAPLDPTADGVRRGAGT